MSDNSLCYFDRHDIKIVVGDDEMPTPKPVLKLKVSDGDWEVLSNQEFSSKIVKSNLLGVEAVFISGETHKFLKFFTTILPMFYRTIPTIICIEGCRALFLNRVKDYVSGICLDIKLPIKEEYTKEDRSFFRRTGEYRPPERYKDNILDIISEIVNKKYSILRIDGSLMSEENLLITKKFLSDRFNLKIVVST